MSLIVLATTSLIVFSGTAVFWYLTTSRDYLPGMDPRIPRLRGADKYIGLLRDLDFNQNLRYGLRNLGDYGSLCVSHLLGMPVVYVGRPEQAKEVIAVLREKPQTLAKTIGTLLGPESILFVPYAEWVPLRKNLGQVFHLRNMKSYFGGFVDSALDFVARIDGHNARRRRYFEDALARGLSTKPTTLLEPLDVDKCCMDLALDVVTGALFSKNLAIQRGNSREFTACLERITPLFMKTLNPLFWLMHPFQYREYRRNVGWFHGTIAGWINERRADPNDNNNNDLLGLMLDARNPDTNEPLAPGVILAQCVSFYFAGHDTTAHSMAWALYEIARHPEVEEKIFEELCDVMGDRETPTYEEASRLTYLQWVVKETLRLHPPGGSFSRYTTEATEIDRVRIPAGVMVEISILAIHYSELVWPEPWRFRPERFSDQESEGRHHCAWIPFGLGERNCIGMNFALAEIRTVLAVLCKKYRLAPSVDMLPHTVSLITITPVDGIHVHIIPRDR